MNDILQRVTSYMLQLGNKQILQLLTSKFLQWAASATSNERFWERTLGRNFSNNRKKVKTKSLKIFKKIVDL